MTDGKDPITGKFTAGNRFWLQSAAGAIRAFETADQLRAACLDYFNWTHDNPLMAAELVKYEGQASVAVVPKMRAMTQEGLCMHIGVTSRSWRAWRTDRPDLQDVIEWAEAVIFRQKFEGAAAELLNPGIIARELGLADRQDHSGTIKAEVSSDAAFAQLASLLGGAVPGAQGGADGKDGLAQDGQT